MRSLVLVAALMAVGEPALAAVAETIRITPRVIGGSPVAAISHPWMVSLQSVPWGNDNEFYSQHLCGGSLIAANWVLTAAHCVDETPAGELRVVVGGGDVEPTELSLDQLLAVAAVYPYPDFDDSALDQDLALLYVPGATASVYVTPAQAVDTNALAIGDALQLVGYGITDNGDVSSSLLGVTLPFKGIGSACQGAPTQERGWLTDNMFCAGGVAGQDSCQGDSGGPLFERRGSQVIQHGVVSWGFSTCGEGTPGVYTHLANYQTWLGEQRQWGLSSAVLLPQPDDQPIDFNLAVANYSDQPLVLDGLTLPAGVTVSAGGNCSSAVLSAGESCALTVTAAAGIRPNGLQVTLSSSDGAERSATLGADIYRHLYSGDGIDGYSASFSNWSLSGSQLEATLAPMSDSSSLLLVASRSGTLNLQWRSPSAVTANGSAILYNRTRDELIAFDGGVSGQWSTEVVAGDQLELLVSAERAMTFTVTSLAVTAHGLGVADDAGSGGGGSVGGGWLLLAAIALARGRRPL